MQIPLDPQSPSETVGKKALDLQAQDDPKINVIDLQREIHKGTNSKRSYEEEIWETVDRARRDSTIKGDFYVVVLFKKERHLQNIVRQYFFYRQSCPTPEYDQTVYKYHRKRDEIEFIWCVPNNAACVFLPQMPDLPEDQMMLLSMVQAFNSGDLEKYAARLNNEPKTF